MASDKRTTPGATPGKRRRAHPAPTIDLTATEVAAPPPEPDRTAAEPSRSESASAAFAGLEAKLTWPPIAAGLVGAMAVTLVLFVLWLTGMVPIRYAGSTAMRARVTVLEMQMRDLRSQPAVDAKTLNQFSQRLAGLEQAIAKLPAGDPALAERLAAVENAIKALGVTLAALNRSAEEAAAGAAAARALAEAAAKTTTELQSQPRAPAIERADLDALAERIAALERSAKAAERETATAAGTPDPALRLVLAAALLRDAVVRGESFAAELAAVKSLGVDVALLAPLEPFAVTGLPGEAALARELVTLTPAMLQAAGAPTEGGFIKRLQANAGKLVRVRPVSEPAGDDAAAVLARIEVKAAHADATGALAELAKLPAAARAPAQQWIKRAQARQAALDASRSLAAASFRALGKP